MVTIYALKRAMKHAGYNRFTIAWNGITGAEIRVNDALKVKGKPAFWAVIERFGMSNGGGSLTFHQIKPFGIGPEDFGEHDLTMLDLCGILEDSDDYKNFWEASNLRSLNP